MKKTIFIILRVIIYILPIIFILWSISQYFAFSGTQKFVYDFSKDSAFVSILWPPERTSDIYQKDGNFIQEIKADPTSFSVQLTRQNFATAKIFLTYQKPEEIPLKLGLQKGDGSWNFIFKDPITTKDPSGKWTIGAVQFELSPKYITPANKINIIISSPYLAQSGAVIKISRILVILQKDPVRLKDLWDKIRGFL